MVSQLSPQKLSIYRQKPEKMKRDTHYPIYQAGHEHGYDEAMKLALTYLEEEFMNEGTRPEKGTPEYEAMLTVARNLATKLREGRPVGQ